MVAQRSRAGSTGLPGTPCLDYQRKQRRDRRLAESVEQLALAAAPRLEDPLDEIEMKRTLQPDSDLSEESCLRRSARSSIWWICRG